MAEEWIGVVNASMPKYLRGAEDLTLRDRFIFKYLQNKGRIELNQSGAECIWDVDFMQASVESYPDGGRITYEPTNRLQQLKIDWRGYKVSDSMTRKQRLMNSSDVAIVQRYEKIIPKLLQDIRDKFGAELYIDGDASGNENRIHGLQSFMGEANSAAGNRISTPNDTYGNLTTNLGNQGGTWTSDYSTYPNVTLARDWPDGTGDSHYDYIAPKLVNYSSTAWGTSSATDWETNCVRVLRQAQMWLTHTGGREGRPDIALLSSNLFYDFKNKQDAKLSIWVPHKEANDLGFPGVLNFEGMAIDADYDCAVNTGYMINVDKMSLASLASNLFHSVGPIYDPNIDAWLFHTGFFGNCRYQPKHFARIAAYG